MSNMRRSLFKLALELTILGFVYAALWYFVRLLPYLSV